MAVVVDMIWFMFLDSVVSIAPLFSLPQFLSKYLVFYSLSVYIQTYTVAFNELWWQKKKKKTIWWFKNTNQQTKSSCQKPLHYEIQISQLKINRPIHTLSAHSYSFLCSLCFGPMSLVWPCACIIDEINNTGWGPVSGIVGNSTRTLSDKS